MPSVKDLDKMENIAPRVKKSTGSRRVTVSKGDDIADRLAACEKPSEVGKIAREFEIPLDVILERGKGANNFGQFRMVIGNRIRGIQNRMARAKQSGKELTLKDAASAGRTRTGGNSGSKPAAKKAASKKTASKKTASKKTTTKKTTKKVTKKTTAKAAPRQTKVSGKKVAKKAGKKVGKKTASKSGIGGEAFSDRVLSQGEADDMARSFGSKFHRVTEFASRQAAVIHYEKNAKKLTDDHHFVYNADEEDQFKDGVRWVLAELRLLPSKETKMVEV